MVAWGRRDDGLVVTVIVVALDDTGRITGVGVGIFVVVFHGVTLQHDIIINLVAYAYMYVFMYV